ncbi:MAG: recombination protein O N-terminal domain-containing protein [Prevotellaceae bacterium]|nr:recombination protein O N-terminal domain-containing protein [Prevotellaceae bacterium]
MFLSSRAIVLSKVRHTDSTFIATLYTEQAGSVAFAVRIPKTSRATIKPQLFQPLTLLTIEWDNREQQSLQRLRNAHLLAPYTTLHTHPHKAAVSAFLAETLYHALHQENNGNIFSFIHHSLLWYDCPEGCFVSKSGYVVPKSGNVDNFPLIFLAQLTDHLGIGISAANGAPLPYFDLIEGEYTPTQPPHLYYLYGRDALFVHTLRRIAYPTLHLLRLTPAEQHRALRAIVAYYRIHIPDFPKLRSLDILRDLLS